MSRKLLILFTFLFVKHVHAQTNITGHVMEIIDSREAFIPGANVYWLSVHEGTLTDSMGYFSLPLPDSLPQKLVISFLGYKGDTLLINSNASIKVILKKSIDLKEVDVTAHKEAIAISTVNPLNTEKITQVEILKAACCNLSEAFETNPSVNVAYKDAVTGVKEIQMLGLGGTYVQILNENIPDMRGLAGIYGLTFIPGPWIESIQLTKGSGSVVNGYESTTGQINVEYKKPLDIELPRIYLNLFADERGGTEANFIAKHKFKNKWSSLLLLNGRLMQKEVDRNNDGFMDIPGNKTINIYNRWEYHDNKKLEAQVSAKFLVDEINGGQVQNADTNPLYKTLVNTKRAEVDGKLGFIYPEKPLKSIGNIFQATWHDMASSFGNKSYDANEKSVYLQSIYQNILWKSNHRYKAGISYRYNQLEQHFPGLPEKVVENIPGVFLEYTYSYFDKFTLIAGMREDLQQNTHWVFTPRLHGKYNFSDNFILRFSGGKSYRTPYLIADHLSVLATSREIIIKENINPEQAWNYGINLTKRMMINGHEITFSADAYRTDFINQLILDSYTDSSKIYFYNLNGRSFSNSLQFTLNVEIIYRINLRLSYKYDDVQSTYNGLLEEQPLTAKNRALGTISYATGNQHWKFDYTLVWEGTKKLQNVYHDDDIKYNNYSPQFTVMNFQATKVFRRFEIYAGVENILDFRQPNPIINPENPFGNSFDATNVWGPIQGRRIYVGLRFTVK